MIILTVISAFSLLRVRRQSFIRDPYPVKCFLPEPVMAIIEPFDGTHCSAPKFAGALPNYFTGHFPRNSAC
jgi:hypothetical protein